jgi:hypothetical protein
MAVNSSLAWAIHEVRYWMQPETGVSTQMTMAKHFEKPIGLTWIAAILMAAALTLGSRCFAGSAITISEIRIDQPSSDVDEYFELAGEPGAPLDGLTYIVIGDGAEAQGSGVIENVTPLTGLFINGNGFFVVAESTFTLGVPDLNAGANGLNFENGDNVTHLVVSGFTGVNGSDLDTNDDGVLDLTPWTAVVDSIALIAQPNPPTSTEWHYGPPAVGPEGTFVPGHVYRCVPPPKSSEQWQIGLFDPGAGSDSPGASNGACTGNPTTGACCMTDGTCTGALTATQCAAARGAYQGDASECAGVRCPQPCPGDIDGSGTVNVDDLLSLINGWGPCPGGCAPDLNGDQVVNVDDLLALINAWGPCP